MSQTKIALVAALLVVIIASPVRADEDVCFSAAVDGQRAYKATKLREAREAFTRCAQAACPAEVTQRCTDWIAEVDEAMPSVIVAPEDARGRDLARGVVTVDGKEESVLAGRSLVLEPGQHVLVLDVPGEKRVEETIVLREHEKNRRVVLQLAARPVEVRRASAAPFVLGGVGLAFAASFGAFGVAGVVDRQSSHCDVACNPSDHGRVQAELVTADISLGVAALFVTLAIVDFVVTRTNARKLAAFAPLRIVF